MVINPNGGAVMSLPTQPPDQLRPSITTWASEVLVTDILTHVPVVTRVGLTIDGSLTLLSAHQPALNIDDVTVPQVHRSPQLLNQEPVKFRYVT